MRINIKVDVQAAFFLLFEIQLCIGRIPNTQLEGEKMAKELDISIWIANRSEWADFCWIFQLELGVMGGEVV